MGYPADLFPERVDPDALFGPVEGFVEPGGPPEHGDSMRSLIWERDCYVAVENVVTDLLPFTRADHQSTAAEAIALLASFPRKSNETIPVLQALVEEGGIRSSLAVLSLAALDGPNALAKAEQLTSDEDRTVALLAACAASLADPDNVSDTTSAWLVTPLGDLGATYSPQADSLEALVARCVALLPSGKVP